MTALLPESLYRRRLTLEARHAEARRGYTALHQEVLVQQSRVSWQPEVKAVLEALQREEHERSVGAYERLLTALLEDVLPGPREVVMDLRTERGLPALDVYLRKGAGMPLEDALHGTGGSVANVLSAGLRMIALVRSGKRRFMVVDEGDCWIKPSLAPRFAAVIQEMAIELGLQVLMISHHDESLFNFIPHRLRLERQADGLTAQWAPTSEAPVWSDDQTGLRSILLENVQAHSLTYLPLSPGVTLLHGENDIGKSAVVTALRAVFMGEANETIVRHHEKEAQVTLDFGPDHLLRWTRKRKGAPVESYRLYEASGSPDQPLHGSNTASVPDWLDGAIGIGTIDGLDVQLRHQKKPVFLLDEPAPKRAKALAVGLDAGYVQTMLALDKEDLGKAKLFVKQGEKQLEQLDRQIQATGLVVGRAAQWDLLQLQAKTLEEGIKQRELNTSLSHRLEAAQKKLHILKPTFSCAHPKLPDFPMSPSTRKLQQRWERAQNTYLALSIRSYPTLPTLPQPQSSQLTNLAQRWALATQRSKTLEHLPQRPFPTLPAAHSVAVRRLGDRWARATRTKEILTEARRQPLPYLAANSEAEAARSLLDKWKRGQDAKDQAAVMLQQAQTQEQQAKKALEQGFPACPTCLRPWEGHLPETHP